MSHSSPPPQRTKQSYAKSHSSHLPHQQPVRHAADEQNYMVPSFAAYGPQGYAHAEPMVLIPQRLTNSQYQHHTLEATRGFPFPASAPQQQAQRKQTDVAYVSEQGDQRLAIPPSPTSSGAVDYQLLLLSLAEEYIAAAHGLGSVVALTGTSKETDRYYKLMATGMGCMEAALKKSRLHPRTEATVRLRYATLLHEETENDAEAQSVLSKGINLCSRNRLLDLRYSMHHLLARVLFKSSPRAALNSVSKVLEEVEAYQHVAWIYAFRFLRTSLSLAVGSHGELLSASQNLRAISTLAEKQRDYAVFITANAFEALVHLRGSSPDSVTQAQHAIASARKMQLDEVTKQLPQLTILLHYLDLACSLRHGRYEEAMTKLQAVQIVLDEVGKQRQWKGDDYFSVSINSTSAHNLTTSTGGIFTKDNQARDQLNFSWLSLGELYTLGYFLSGVTSFAKANSESTAERYTQESLRMLGDQWDLSNPQPDSVSRVCARLVWQAVLGWYIRVHLVFIYCTRADWQLAGQTLEELKADSPSLPAETAESREQLTTYLDGVIAQGSGDLSSALKTFQSPILALPPPSTRTQSPSSEISILAALNSLLIIRDPAHPSHALAEPLIAHLETLLGPNHPNLHLVASFHLLNATASDRSDIIIKMKQDLQQTLKDARAASNVQLLSIALSLITARFFHRIVGAQSEKSARAAVSLASKAGNKLWESVGDGMLADLLDMQGNSEEAEVVRAKAMKLVEELPHSLQAVCSQK